MTDLKGPIAEAKNDSNDGKTIDNSSLEQCNAEMSLCSANLSPCWASSSSQLFSSQAENGPTKTNVQQHRNYISETGLMPSMYDWRSGCSNNSHTTTSRRVELTLYIAALLTTVFILVQLVGGYISHSLAIVADSCHMLTDLFSFLVSIVAVRLSRKPPSKKFTFGFHRAEALGALASVLIIWLLIAGLVYAAIERVLDRQYAVVDPDTMLLTAIAGVLFNVALGLVLCASSSGHFVSKSADKAEWSFSTIFQHVHSAHHCHAHKKNNAKKVLSSAKCGEKTPSNSSLSPSASACSNVVAPSTNLNVRAAFVHVLGDLVQSVGVVIAALLIKFTGFSFADPLCTFLFSALAFVTTVPVFRDAILILMEAWPDHVDYEQLYVELRSIPGVQQVHALRVWWLKSECCAAMVHLEVDEGRKSYLPKGGGGTTSDEKKKDTEPEIVVQQVHELLRNSYSIGFTTIQVFSLSAKKVASLVPTLNADFDPIDEHSK